MVADRRFRDRTSRHLGQDPLVNPPCRVTLLARSRRIRLENGIDERHNRFQGRLGARAIATQRRQGALHRLAHHPAMNAERPRHTLHRADPELVLAAQPLEQFHLRSPVQTTPRTSTAGRRTLGHTRRGGPTFASTGGPSFDSEATPRRGSTTSIAASAPTGTASVASRSAATGPCGATISSRPCGTACALSWRSLTGWLSSTAAACTRRTTAAPAQRSWLDPSASWRLFGAGSVG